MRILVIFIMFGFLGAGASVKAQEAIDPLEFIVKTIKEVTLANPGLKPSARWVEGQLEKTGEVQFFDTELATKLPAFPFSGNSKENIQNKEVEEAIILISFMEENKNAVEDLLRIKGGYFLFFDFSNDGLDDIIIWTTGGTMVCSRFIFFRRNFNVGYQIEVGPQTRFQNEGGICSNSSKYSGRNTNSWLKPMKVLGRNLFFQWDGRGDYSTIKILDFDYKKAKQPIKTFRLDYSEYTH